MARQQRRRPGAAGRLADLIPGELRRVASAPYEVLTCVGANGLLAVVLWFLAPSSVSDLFFSFHAAFLFPVVLSTWMLADVPATNQLGADPEGFLPRLGDAQAVAELLRAKQLVLMLLVWPIGVAAALIFALDHASWMSLAFTLAWVGTVPFAGLGLSCVAGVRWPYHPIPLRERWARRRDRRGSLRWVSLILLPYVLVPAVGIVGLLPPGLVYVARHGTQPVTDVTRADDLPLAIGAGVAVPVALLLWRWATAHAGRVAVARGEELRSYLADPARG